MRPTVAMAIEKRGWCFHNNALAISRRLSDEFRFVIGTAPELLQLRENPDLLVPLWWGFSLQLKVSLKARGLLPCVYDAWSWRGEEHSAHTFRLVARQATAIGAANRGFLEAIRDHVGDTCPPVHLLEDGVDTDLFSACPLPPRIVAGWTGNSNAVIPGAPDEGKGLGLVRKACKRAGVDLLILDAASSGRTWAHEEMPRFYRDISLYVCASDAEGTPNPVLEALSCGRPVVSTRVGLVPDLARKAPNAVLTVDRDPGAIAGGIREMASRLEADPSGITSEARGSVLGKSWDIQAERWRLALRETIARAADTPRRRVMHIPQPHIRVVPPPPKPPKPPVVPAPLSRKAPTPAARPVVHAPPREPPFTSRVPTPEELERPRPTPDRPRVLLISDQPDWAFRRNMLDLESYLRDTFQFRHWAIADWLLYRRTRGAMGEDLPRLDELDVVFAVYHRWGIDHLLPWNRTVGSLRAQWFVPENPRPPGPEEFALVNRYRAFHVVTQRNYEELAPHCPRVVYLTNPVDMRRHPRATPVTRRVICSWNGNARHGTRDVKGFHSIVQPACRAAGVPLEYAEYNTRKIPLDEMPEFYMRANLALCASEYEGSSNSVLEAMASGHALITTDCGNHREIQESQLEHLGDTGIVIVERSVQAFRDAILRLKRAPERVAEMGRINRAEIQERWSWAAWKDRYADFLRMALED